MLYMVIEYFNPGAAANIFVVSVIGVASHRRGLSLWIVG